MAPAGITASFFAPRGGFSEDLAEWEKYVTIRIGFVAKEVAENQGKMERFPRKGKRMERRKAKEPETGPLPGITPQILTKPHIQEDIP
jgi:hypothetical protein